MTNVVDRQTFVFSIDFATATTSQINTSINLRFAADELILKGISYNVAPATDTEGVVQIWCNLTNDNLIGSFPNNVAVFQNLNSHFRLNNTFQTGNLLLQFQQTGLDTVFHYNPEALDNGSTLGVVALTIEFIKLKNKEIY